MPDQWSGAWSDYTSAILVVPASKFIRRGNCMLIERLQPQFLHIVLNSQSNFNWAASGLWMFGKTSSSFKTNRQDPRKATGRGNT